MVRPENRRRKQKTPVRIPVAAPPEKMRVMWHYPDLRWWVEVPRWHDVEHWEVAIDEAGRQVADRLVFIHREDWWEQELVLPFEYPRTPDITEQY